MQWRLVAGALSWMALAGLWLPTAAAGVTTAGATAAAAAPLAAPETKAARAGAVSHAATASTVATVPPASAAAPSTAATAATVAAPATGTAAGPATPAAARLPKIGLVLSGGGARGLAHIGVLKVLEELRVPVAVVTGTSMGAIVGGAYAAGYTAAQLEELARTTDWDGIFASRAPRDQLGWRAKEDDFKSLSGFEVGITARGPGLPRGLAGTQQLELFLRRVAGPVRDVNNLARLPLPFAATATDFANGRLVVLREGVSLATAMRASMSVPGAFAPVERDGKLLVDGGLVRNLPVDLARDLGAEVIIAVNVGTPPLAREQLVDVVSLFQQYATLLGQDAVERSLAELGPRDILIAPKLDAHGAGDFGRAAAIIGAGEQAAQALRERLAALSVGAAAFEVAEQRRTVRVRGDAPVAVDEVRIGALTHVAPAAVAAELDVPLGRPLSGEDLARAMDRVYATGDFESVRYSLVDEADRRVLLVTPFEKSWGYNAVRLGGSVQTDFFDDSRFTLLLAHTWRWVNAWGGEWRNEVQIGEERRLASEFIQPLGTGSPWFLQPRLESLRQPLDRYVDGVAVARYALAIRSAELGLGRALGRIGVARVGIAWAELTGWRKIGSPDAPSVSADSGLAFAQLRLDTLDSTNLPRRGGLLEARYDRYRSPLPGGDRDAWSVTAQHALTFDRYTVQLGVRTALAAVDGGVRLGGLFNLSGTPSGAVAGGRAYLVRALAYRNISDAFGDVKMPVYAGLSLESGAAWSRFGGRSGDDIANAGSLFLAFESPVGPMYFAWGRTFGASQALYLVWGRPR